MSRILSPLFCLVLVSTTVAQEGKVLFSEKFADKLDKDWSWVREDAKAWRLEKGALVLKSLPGYLHAKSNNSKNVLLRPLPKSDKPLAIEVYVECEPKTQFEHAGVVWYVDDDNYVTLFQETLNKKIEMQMVLEKDAKPRFAVKSFEEKGVWVRLVVTGAKFSAEYRPTPKEEWRVVGQGELPSDKPARVGVMAGGTPKDAERYARFQSFRIVEVGK